MLTFFSPFCAWGTTIIGDSKSVVITESLLLSVKVVERFLRLTLVEKKPAKHKYTFTH